MNIVRLRDVVAGAVAALTLALLPGETPRASTVFALQGMVRGPDAQPMEGVLVNLRSTDNARLISVASNAAGRYEFPASRTPGGSYELSVRAVGYVLPATQDRSIRIETKPTSRDLRLVAVTDRDVFASQLTSLEWLNSWPGSDDAKRAMMHNIVNCAFCHSLERIAQTTYDASEFMPVIQRMLTYETDHSSAERIQRVAPPSPLEGLSWFGTDAAQIATYLATVNRGNPGEDWSYEFKTLPRPSGRETQAVVTVFPIPRTNSVIHDLDVDSSGRVWFGNTGWDYLGLFDPRTDEFFEWPAPNFLPDAQPGVDRILGVQDIQVDPKGHVWVATGGTKLTRFVPETGKWQAFDLPVIWRNPFLSPVREGEQLIWATGLAAPPDGHKRHETAYALDTESGKLSAGINLFDHMPPPEDPFHSDPLNYCYMMDQDKDHNFLCTAPVPSGIVRGNRETGESTFYPTPTRHAYPRRGYRDDRNRFWFSEFYADRIGVFDLNDNSFREYPLTPRFISPYFARPDKRGFVWASSTGSDRLLRLDPETGDVLKFLMPVYYDARKVVVDESASHTTVWLPSKNTAELIRVELFDGDVSTD